jgi:NAD(P) transhydrogenase subunit alpha
MLIAVPKERRPDETRVAATPDMVKKYVGLGFQVLVETGAGEGASINDAAYVEAGAAIAKTAKAALKDADIVLKVQRPGTVLIAHLAALAHKEEAELYAKAGLIAFALELLPRISRAQSMDILSSQSNLAGYKAVLDAAAVYGRAFPMMMTAAGTIPPAKVLVLGAGVAGLQAIATARRLGGVVSAFDVRPAVKEQVESLGAKFVMVEDDTVKDAETAGGYAKEMSADYQRKQSEKIAETLKKTDIAICTALIPGKPAPVLITEAMVKDMRKGSVIVDLAVEAGGNCPLSEFGKVVEKHGVFLVGHANVPARLAADASQLYAKNLLNFLTLSYDKDNKGLKIDWDDDIIKGTALCRDGKVIHPALIG